MSSEWAWVSFCSKLNSPLALGIFLQWQPWCLWVESKNFYHQERNDTITPHIQSPETVNFGRSEGGCHLPSSLEQRTWCYTKLYDYESYCFLWRWEKGSREAFSAIWKKRNRSPTCHNANWHCRSETHWWVSFRWKQKPSQRPSWPVFTKILSGFYLCKVAWRGPWEVLEDLWHALELLIFFTING